jgi:hypothetical protein
MRSKGGHVLQRQGLGGGGEEMVGNRDILVHDAQFSGTELKSRWRSST